MLSREDFHFVASVIFCKALGVKQKQTKQTKGGRDAAKYRSKSILGCGFWRRPAGWPRRQTTHFSVNLLRRLNAFGGSTVAVGAA
jgi:hypothetical protein